MKIYGNIKIHEIERTILYLLIFAKLIKRKGFFKKISKIKNGDFGLNNIYSTPIL